MAEELAAVYLSIIPETSKIAPGVVKALRGAEKGAATSGRSMGTRMSAAMGGALKKTAVGVGITAGAALGAGLTKGIGRLNGIEQAEAKLRGLGHSASGVGAIMDNALASVKGTSFGLEEAATAAAGAVAAGIAPGQELERTLKVVGDTATIAGANFNEMGAIFNSVAARGKLQGDDMMQLLSRGVPVLQLLGDELGKTSAEISEMVSAGEIDFATFQAAMETGMSGAALEAGNTVEGAMRNMGAAAGRLGATLSGPFFNQAAGAFGGVTEALDAMNGAAGPIMADLDRWIRGTAVPAFHEFATAGAASWRAFADSEQARQALADTMAALEAMGVVVRDLAPSVGTLGAVLAQASASLGISTWDVLVNLLEAAATILDATLVPALEVVAELAQENQGAVTALVGAWMAFKTVPGVVGRVQKPLGRVTEQMTRFRTIHPELTRTAAAMQLLGERAPAVSQMGAAFRGAQNPVKGLGKAMKAGAKPAMAGMASGAKGLIGVMGGPWGVAFAAAAFVVTDMIKNLRRAKAANEALENQAKATEAASAKMFDALAEGSAPLDAAEQATTDVTAELQNLGDNGPTALARIGIAIDEASGKAGEWLGTLEEGTAKARTQWRDQADAAKEAMQVMDDLGLSNRDLAAAAMGTEGAYRRMREELMANGRGGQLLAEQMGQLREKFQAAERAAERMGPAGLHAAEALEQVREKAGSAEDRTQALRMAFLELAGIEVSSAEASAQLTRTIDSMSSRMGDFAGATLTAAGAIDTTTTAGAELHSALLDMGNEMQRAVTAGEPAGEVFTRSADALEQMRISAGLSEEQWAALLDKMGMTPERLTVVAEVESDAFLASLTSVERMLGEFSGTPTTVTMQIADESAREKLEQLGFTLSNLDAESGTVDITVKDEAALLKLDSFINEQLPRLDAATATATADLDASRLFASDALAAAQLATLNLKRPTPVATMDISRLDAQQVEALQKVGLLDGQTPTPDADLNIDQLTADQQIALAQIFDLDAQNPTPLADLTKDELDAKVNKAQVRLTQLDQSHTEPEVTANTDDALSKLGTVKSMLEGLKNKNIFVNIFRRNHTDGNAEGGRFAAGGRLPAYADGDRHDGYRLPTTGRGAHTTDGFTALDASGMPVARLDRGEWIINRRSSEKYDRELAEINRGTFPKLPGYADGGMFDDIQSGTDMPTAQDFLRFARGEQVNGAQASRPLSGAPYIWGGSDWGDCSGTASAFAAFGIGLPPFPRKFATGTEEQWLRDHGFTMGRGRPGTLRIGWYNGGPAGGHTSVTLPDGTAAEMGGSSSSGKLGGAAAGADNPNYTHHAWLAVAPGSTDAGPATDTGSAAADGGGDPDLVPLDGEAAEAADTITGGGDSGPGLLGGSSTWSDLSGSVLAGIFGGQVKVLLGAAGLPDDLPPLVKAAQQWHAQRRERDEKVQRKLIAVARGITGRGETADAQAPASATPAPDAPATPADAAAANAAPGAAGAAATAHPAEEAADPAADPREAVRGAVRDRGWDTGAQFEALDYIISHESGWNPTAVNPTSGAFGLPQFNPASGTLQEYLPDRNPDPAVQGAAMARYIADRYGTPEDAARFWRANHWYDAGGLAGGRGHLLKNTLKPERVLSPEQTRAFEHLVYDTLPGLAGANREQPAQEDAAAAPPAEAAAAPGGSAPAPEPGDGALSTATLRALPQLLESNSLADVAGMMASSTVRSIGTAATSAVSQVASGMVDAGAGSAVAAPLAAPAAALGMVPGLGGAGGGLGALAGGPLGSLLPGPALGGNPIEMVGGAATEMAAWYAGEVAHGVVGAGEQYAKDLVGVTAGGVIQDVLGVVKHPVVTGAAGALGVDLPAIAAADTPAPAQPQAQSAGGDITNINVTDTAQAFAVHRREMAKKAKGMVGAR